MTLNKVFVPDVVDGEARGVRREPSDTLIAHEVVRAARITYRQLDYWVTTGIVDCLHKDGGTGIDRHFTIQQARVAAAVGRLVEAGVTLDTARHVASELSQGASTIGLGPTVDLVLGSRVYALKPWAVEEC